MQVDTLITRGYLGAAKERGVKLMTALLSVRVKSAKGAGVFAIVLKSHHTM